MRGRFCTQPFLVERGSCRPAAFLLPLRWVSRSPPHPPQCAHWGTFPPRGRLWAWVRPFPTTTPTFPSPPSWGAGRYGRGTHGPQARQKKREDPRRVPPNQKRWVQGGRTSSSLVFFPPAFSKESRAPPPESAGETTSQGPPCAGPEGPKRGPRRVGALRGAAPRGLGKAPPTQRVRSTAIPLRQARAPPNGPLFFCAILCNFFAPTVYAGVQLWPRFPRG